MQLQGFHPEEMGCSTLFTDMELHTAAVSKILLLSMPSVHGLLQALFVYVLQFSHVLFSLLKLVATLVPYSNIWSIQHHWLGIPLLVWQCCSTAVARYVYSCLDGLNFCTLQLVLFCCYFAFTTCSSLTLGFWTAVGCCGSRPPALYDAELYVWVVDFSCYADHSCSGSISPLLMHFLYTYLLIPQP